jgi:hypothetical protein
MSRHMSVQRISRWSVLVLLLSSSLAIAQNNVAQDSHAAGQRSQTAQVASSANQIQGQDTSRQTIVNPDGSSISDNHYKNPFFDFTVDFPQGWLLFNNTEAKAEIG